MFDWLAFSLGPDPAKDAEILILRQQVAVLRPPGQGPAAVASWPGNPGRGRPVAAGLQLAASSLRGQADAAAFVASFTGSHRYVLDYLGEEVLECQPEQLQTFLLETSVLERLTGGLCDAVTGRAGSQALLEQVEQAGLFLLPLDEVRLVALPPPVRRSAPRPPAAGAGPGGAAAPERGRLA